MSTVGSLQTFGQGHGYEYHSSINLSQFNGLGTQRRSVLKYKYLSAGL